MEAEGQNGTLDVGLLYDNKTPLRRCMKFHPWMASMCVVGTTLVVCVLSVAMSLTDLSSTHALSNIFKETSVNFIAPLSNVSSTQQRSVAHEPATPLLLIEGFEQISCPEPYMFEGIEQGVSYMARFVASSVSIAPSQTTFWAPLLQANRVHHIFRAGHAVLKAIIPNDVDIYTAVSLFFHIANHGTKIADGLHAAYAFNLRSIVVVQTQPNVPTPALTDAWTTFAPVVRGVSVDKAIAILCKKLYFNGETIESLTYACAAQLFGASQQPR